LNEPEKPEYGKPENEKRFHSNISSMSCRYPCNSPIFPALMFKERRSLIVGLMRRKRREQRSAAGDSNLGLAKYYVVESGGWVNDLSQSTDGKMTFAINPQAFQFLFGRL
jgi:hypothetical protein